MKERGILFSAPMVKALLAGTKTQTRRVFAMRQDEGADSIVPIDPHPSDDGVCRWGYLRDGVVNGSIANPYGAAGDRLWVRETFIEHACNACEIEYATGSKEKGHDCRTPRVCSYRADSEEDLYPGGWRPSIFMPRWASRITLEITDVRVERLQAITEEDARAEGVKTGEMLPAMINGEPGQVMIFSPVKAYAVLWDSINGKKCPWSSNPWVWALTFKRVT